MREMLRAELGSLRSAWLVCLSLALPALLLWRSSDGRNLALACLFVGCASLVAYSFRRELADSDSFPASGGPSIPRPVWGVKMLALAVALLAAAIVFSALLFSLNDLRDYESFLVAILIPVPSLCMVPYLTLSTRKPYAAVVFALFLVGCMKLVGGAVVWVVYGPNSVQEGHTRMPWLNPNLLVWVFWVTTAALSVALYALGYRRFQEMRRFRCAKGRVGAG